MYRWPRMIAELTGGFYDAYGHRVSRPSKWHREQGFRPTFPMGRNLTGRLSYPCHTFEDMRKFLSTCRYAREDLDRREYWQPPEELERRRAGLCVDFAIWAWRQLVDMGYPSRFVGGKAGKFGEGHAWVTFQMNGTSFLLEPQMWYLGLKMPKILTLRYHPRASVAWNGRAIEYYTHQDRVTDPPIRALPGLLADYLSLYARFWATFVPRVLLTLSRKVIHGMAGAGNSHPVV